MTTPPVTCQTCGRPRRHDEHDYTPMDLVTGRPLGWYSGDDGEFCGPCLADIMKGLVP
jgi:hypothetical protein